MILNLIWIHLIVVLVFLSGFVDSVDEAINKRFKFYHLGKPFNCALCSVFWLSVLYLLVAKEFSLLTVLYALVSATLTEITTPLITLIKNLFLKIIELMNKILW